MWKLHLWTVAAALALPLIAADEDPLKQQLNQDQLQEVEQRLNAFQEAQEQQDQKLMQKSMNQLPKKYSAKTGKERQVPKLQQAFSIEQQLKQVQQELNEVKEQKQVDKLKAKQKELQELQQLAKQNPLIQLGQAKVTKQYQNQQAQVVSSQQRIDALQQDLAQMQEQVKQAQQKVTQEKDADKKQQLQKQADKLQRQQKRLARHLDTAKKMQQEDGRAGIAANDRVEDLVESWVDEDELVKDLDVISEKAKNRNSKLPDFTKGKAKVTPWSDDYWALTNGATAWRYASANNSFTNWFKAVESYMQPDRWNKNPTGDSAEWSPAEKYDILVGDVGNGKNLGKDWYDNLENFNAVPGFTLTRSQKGEGKEYWDDAHKVEDWMGICHGWAPAAVMVDRPEKAVPVKGAGGKQVTFSPHDIRALASLQWANGSYSNSFIGGRCNAKKATVLKNGHISDQDCFDNNPATWHLALVNFIGLKQQAFIGDGTFDYEVWNNPIVSYEFSYFNPLKPGERNKDWSKVKVAYDNPAFRKADRFRMGNKGTPTYTRGVISGGRNQEDQIKWVVGVVATVHWTAEITPVKDRAGEDDYNVVTYTYDLEVNAANEPIGGEWHENTHPDFLWMPRKGSVPRSGGDVAYNGTVTDALTTAAQRSSKSGYPLNSVLKYLTSKAADK